MPRPCLRSVSAFLGLVFLVCGLAGTPAARLRTCPPFHLRNDAGEVIDPLAGQNAADAYSPRQTCGACHAYDTVTRGFHFQQGWDRIRDDFNPKQPWVLSDGMLGKM